VKNLEAPAVGCLEEEAAADRQIAVIGLFLVKRAVTCMEYGSRHEFVRSQQIGKQAMARAIKLFKEAHQEMFVELIRCSGVHNRDIEDTFAGRLPAEAHGVDLDVLTEVLVRLKRHSEAPSGGCSLEWTDWVVVNLASFIEASADIEPTQDLDVTENSDSSSGLVAASQPWFMSASVIDI